MTIFQKIINKQILADILYEDDDLIAFYDTKPKSPGHFLVVPKNLSINLIDIKDKDLEVLIKKTRKLALEEIKKRNVSGFQLIINNGESAGQEVFHTHIHIIPSEQ